MEPGLEVPMPMRMPSAMELDATYKAGLLKLPTSRVLVATSAWLVLVPVTCALPDCTESLEPGEVEPRPRKPDVPKERKLLPSILLDWLPTNRVDVATNACVVEVPVTCKLPPCTERRDPGLEVPMPMRMPSLSVELAT